MADLPENTANWLAKQPIWIQKAADMLSSRKELSHADLGSLVSCIKDEEATYGEACNENWGFTLDKTQGKSLRLLSIGDIEGIDKLSPNEPLSFGAGNLVVIYGHNGSGKSGFSRILKNVSGKERAPKLQPNVFQKFPDERRCTISFQLDNDTIHEAWNVDDPPITQLKEIDIFDGEEAEFYLTGESTVTYTPPEILLFERLGKACGQLRDILQDQQDKLVKRIPELPVEFRKTSAGKKYQNITDKTTQDKVLEIVAWSPDFEEKLKHIEKRLEDNEIHKLVESKKKKSRLLKEMVARIESSIFSTSHSEFERLLALKNNATDKRNVAIQSAKALTDTSKVEGIGTDTWKALWEAARRFSTEQAYSDLSFPNVDEGSVCVFCQQELSLEASKRLEKLNEFVEGTLETDAQAAERAVQMALESLPQPPNAETIESQSIAAELSEEIVQSVKDFWASIASRLKLIKKFQELNELSVPAAHESLVEKLKTDLKILDNEIEVHLQEIKDFDREQLTQESLELSSRKWISQQKSGLEEELKRLKEFSKYEEWKKQTNSQGISNQAGKVSQQIITSAYVRRFNDELTSLGAQRIRVELKKTRVKKGKALHRIALRDAEQGDSQSLAVLSDGERRIVSLAAFLADVMGRPAATPFIFDDPISSLDHDFEWEVAMRLARLSCDRQVIVFTHRLSFFGVLEQSLKKVKAEAMLEELRIEQRSIESYGGSTGHPTEHAVWSKNVRKACSGLKQKLASAKKYVDNGEIEVYKTHAQAFCSNFRKLLERSVEDVLLNQIVMRHRRGIMTQDKLGHLVKIQIEDCQFIEGLMSKYSSFEHSQSSELPARIPDYSELLQDIEDLEKWLEEFKKRRLQAQTTEV